MPEVNSSMIKKLVLTTALTALPLQSFAETTDYSKISGWGSSTMEGLNSELTSLAKSFGASYYSGGDGGTKSDAILAAQGSVPAVLEFSDGTVTSGKVTVTNVKASSAIKAISGSISGTDITGTLSSTSSAWTFTLSSGETTTVSGSVEFLPTAGLDNAYSVQILNIGKNDLTSGATAEEIVQAYRTAYEWLPASDKQVIILGQFVDTNTAANSSVRTEILKANAMLKEIFGDRFVDIQSYLTSAQVWEDTGITPTEEDLEQQALGNKPPSLSADNLHMNSAANEAVVYNLIAPILDAVYGYTSFDAPKLIAQMNGIVGDIALSDRISRFATWAEKGTPVGFRIFGSAGGQWGQDSTSATQQLYSLGISYGDGDHWSYRLKVFRQHDSSYEDAYSSKFKGWGLLGSADGQFDDFRLGFSVGKVSGKFSGNRYPYGRSGDVKVPYDTDGDALFSEITAGYVYRFEGVATIIPATWLRFSRSTIDSYSETSGSRRDVSVGKQTSDTIVGGAGVRVNYDAWGDVKPWLGLSLENRISSSNKGFDAALVSGTALSEQFVDAGDGKRTTLDLGVIFPVAYEGQAEIAAWLDSERDRSGLSATLSFSF